MNDMDIQFVERTRYIIDTYKDKYEFTLLLNCTMGLIILPLEVNREHTLRYLNRSLEEINIINSILKKDSKHILNPTIRNIKTRKFEQAPKTLKTFLYKIRNSLAHFANSEVINENGEWTKIRLMDVNKYNGNNIELDITIDKADLIALAQYLSEEYLKEITMHKNKSLNRN